MSTALIALLLHTSVNQACTGAKQMAMGHAGITISDDANSTYWNQAKIPFLKRPALTFTKLVGNCESYRYDNTLSFATPLLGRLGLGLQLMNSSQDIKDLSFEGRKYIIKEGADYNETMNWLKIAAGFKINDNFSVGGAITPKRIHETSDDKKRQGRFLDYELSGLFQKSNLLTDDDRLRLGVLARTWSTLHVKALNLRPGISYTINNKLGDLTLASSYYSALAPFAKYLNFIVVGSPGIRAGIEQKVGNFALRAGMDNAGNRKVLTCGLGYTNEDKSLSVAMKKDYGFLEATLTY